MAEKYSFIWSGEDAVEVASADRITALEAALSDLADRLEGSWERRDLASPSDVEAVANARKLLKD